MALACKGPERVALITDANVGAGLGGGRYRFAGQELVISRAGAAARLGAGSPAPGALAGSGLTMDQAVRNAVKLLGLELFQAVRMASANPAAVLGLGARKGQVRAGFDADLVLLDEALRVTRTWIGGEEWKGDGDGAL
jgi:N-acetylglucosamine-6-phosphate deacetylase